MNETETTPPAQPMEPLPQPVVPGEEPVTEPGPTDPPAEPDLNEPDPPVPGEEEVSDSETMTQEDADADETVDNTESDTPPTDGEE